MRDKCGDLLPPEHVAEGGHLGEARLAVGLEADAVGDGDANVLRRSTPQPFVVVEVRIAGRTGCARTMTLHAVHLESSGARRRGELAQPLVGYDLLDGQRSHGSHIVGPAGLRTIELGAQFRPARIAEQAVGGGRDQRPGRIGDRIGKRPCDGGVEGPQPPARHRVVELPDPVPLMTGGRDAGDVVDMFVAHLNRP